MLSGALGRVFHQVLDEARLLNGTYANTTEEEVEIGGRKYVVQKSVIKGADDHSSIYVESLSTKPKMGNTKVIAYLCNKKGGKMFDYINDVSSNINLKCFLIVNLSLGTYFTGCVASQVNEILFFSICSILLYNSKSYIGTLKKFEIIRS